MQKDYFYFAVNKHGMSSTDMYNLLKSLDTLDVLEPKFIKLLCWLLGKKEKWMMYCVSHLKKIMFNKDGACIENLQ